VKRRRFFTWLKIWLAALSRSVQHDHDWPSRIEEGANGHDGLGLPLWATPQEEVKTHPLRSYLKRGVHSSPSRQFIKSSKLRKSMSWLRKIPAADEPVRVRTAMLPKASHLRRSHLSAKGQNRPIAREHPRRVEAAVSPIRRSPNSWFADIESPPSTALGLRITEFASRQRSAFAFLSLMGEPEARKPRTSWAEGLPPQRSKPGEGRLCPHPRSSSWLHLGPRLAADFYTTNS